jgi:hypothetical protein
MRSFSSSFQPLMIGAPRLRKAYRTPQHPPVGRSRWGKPTRKAGPPPASWPPWPNMRSPSSAPVASRATSPKPGCRSVRPRQLRLRRRADDQRGVAHGARRRRQLARTERQSDLTHPGYLGNRKAAVSCYRTPSAVFASSRALLPLEASGALLRVSTSPSLVLGNTPPTLAIARCKTSG